MPFSSSMDLPLSLLILLLLLGPCGPPAIDGAALKFGGSQDNIGERLERVGGGVNPAGCEDLPDCERSESELIAANGFMPEPHTCRTPDGFLLGMHRIVPSSDPTHRRHEGEWEEGGKGGGGKAKRSVLLLHGLLDSGATWLLNGRNGSLALWLSDRGFDVWLGNSRGNMYSTSHEELLPSQPAFWNWSWDEMAKYDLPAMISCVQRGGGDAGGKIAVVAHSQGTLQTFASLALPTRPSTDDNVSSATPLSQSISVFVALAPVAYVAHLTSPLLRGLSELRRPEAEVIFGDRAFLPSTDALRRLLPAACSQSPWACESVVCMVTGCDPSDKTLYNRTRWPVYVSHYPSGTSVRNMLHWGQSVRKGTMSMYDYGSEAANMEEYGQPSPPAYNLSSIDPTVRIAMLSGTRDLLADEADVGVLMEKLPKSDLVTGEAMQGLDHASFVWGADGPRILFPKVTKLLTA